MKTGKPALSHPTVKVRQATTTTTAASHLVEVLILWSRQHLFQPLLLALV